MNKIDPIRTLDRINQGREIVRHLPPLALSNRPINPSTPHCLCLVHFDPSYFSLNCEKSFAYEASRLADSSLFKPVMQFLTGTRSSCLPGIGEQILWWPTNADFSAKGKDREYTLAGGYYSYCLKGAFSHLADSFNGTETVHLPLPAIFDAKIEYDNGEESIYAEPVSIIDCMNISCGIPEIARRAFPSARFIYATEGVFLEENPDSGDFSITLVFWETTEQLLEAMCR